MELRGATRIGTECRIGTGSVFRDCEIADGAHILPYVVAERTKIGHSAWVGPFSRLRQNAVVGDRCHIGNYVELKNTTMDQRFESEPSRLPGRRVHRRSDQCRCRHDYMQL